MSMAKTLQSILSLFNKAVPAMIVGLAAVLYRGAQELEWMPKEVVLFPFLALLAWVLFLYWVFVGVRAVLVDRRAYIAWAKGRRVMAYFVAISVGAVIGGVSGGLWWKLFEVHRQQMRTRQGKEVKQPAAQATPNSGSVPGGTTYTDVPSRTTAPIPKQSAKEANPGKFPLATDTAATSSIRVTSFVHEANYPVGTVLGGIEWSPEFTDFRLDLSNSGDVLIERADLIVGTDISIMKAGQLSELSGINIFPAAGPISPISISGTDEKGSQITIPVEPMRGPSAVNVAPTYHIFCERIPARTTVRIVLAVARVELGQKMTWIRARPSLLTLQGSYEVREAGGPKRYTVNIKRQLN